MEKKQSHDELFQKFYSLYKKNIPKDYLQFFSEQDLELFIKDRWNFVYNRNKDINIKCYNSENVWPLHTSIVQVNLLDMPFIVDTILDFLKAEKFRIYRVINSILFLKRKDGKIIDIYSEEKEDFLKESYVYIEIEKTQETILNKISQQIVSNLKELKIIINDFSNINEHLLQIKFEQSHLNEDKNWILNHFILMGLITLTNNKIQKQFGLLKKQEYQKIVLKEYNDINSNVKECIIFKESIIKSNVKRYKPLHIVIFKKDQEVFLLLGSFAGKGEISPRFLIPPLKRKLDKIAKLLNAPLNGFRYKEIYKISQLIPLGILFSRKINLIKAWLEFFINNLYTNEQKVLISEDLENSGIWVLIIELQKFADIDNVLVKNLQKYQIIINTKFKRTYNQFLYTFLFLKREDNDLKKLKHILSTNSDKIFYSWYDQFVKYITYSESSLKQIKYKLDYYKEIIPPSLPNYVSPKEAYKNLRYLETITTDKKFYVKFGKSISPLDEKEVKTLNIYSCFYFSLTEIFPALDSVGLNIITEISFDFNIEGTTKYLNIFYLENDFKEKWLNKIEEGIENILNKKYSIEKINILLIKSSLNIREIDFIKTLLSYYYQLHRQYSRQYLQSFFINYTEFSELLIQYLNTIFNDSNKDKKELTDNKEEIVSKIKEYIYKIKTISEQTIAINILEILQNIVRTNFYLNYDEISIKVQTKEISYLKEPKPLFEIFVYSKDIEGIHIRSNYISRGGIRWSDRIDDFRIEIYDLMKTQMIKNTIIIPDGAKGGYIIKKNLQLLSNEEKFNHSKYYYKRFIENLLSLTDNYDKNQNLIHPEGIICLDQFDPYLVVAADKGTATFSDIANEISNQKNFWLKDAFASGGSFGYDHKKQGITAKGAWVSVKRHFSELQIDPEKDIITVIGIGDMSGDVFGNGMILSKTIKLIGAFNHIHIFIDPDPDPELSYKERLRLFKEVKGWDHYNKDLISKGGGIFERNAARIKLTKEIQERFNISKNYVSGEELIRSILKAKADLLWNGGIGTYIKSSTESHKDVKDPMNDNVRINANELNVKVIGEGGNLGLTMRARIEAALKGIKLNTDFIDNSGGVDMSDHEVNLKILLNNLLEKNIINFNKRNQLIRKLEKEMIDKVLNNNLYNNIAIALDYLRLPSYQFLIQEWVNFLEKQNIMPEKEIILNHKITEPEICLLLGYTKLYFKKYFQMNKINYDDSISLLILEDYFTQELLKNYKEFVLNHPLKNQIVTTILINDIINAQGTLFFYTINNIFNKSFNEIFSEYIHFKVFTGFNVLNLYKNYYELPKSFLYEQLINFSNATILIHFFMEDKILKNKNYQNFINNIKILQKLLLKNQPIKTQINQNSLAKKMKEFDSFNLAYEISLIHLFIREDDILNFFSFINQSMLYELYIKIKNVQIKNLQELKFQYRLLSMYFNILKKFKNDNIKKVKNFLIIILKKEQELKLIDLFEVLTDLERWN